MPARANEPSPEAFLKPLSIESELTWADYIAPAQLKAELEALPRRFDPAFREALNRAREKRQGGTSQNSVGKPKGIPMALFTGPCGKRAPTRASSQPTESHTAQHTIPTAPVSEHLEPQGPLLGCTISPSARPSACAGTWP